MFIFTQLASIPGLEDVTVSTPAPSQPSGAAAASAAGSAPPPASDVAQPAGEAQVIMTHFSTKNTCTSSTKNTLLIPRGC